MVVVGGGGQALHERLCSPVALKLDKICLLMAMASSLGTLSLWVPIWTIEIGMRADAWMRDIFCEFTCVRYYYVFPCLVTDLI